MRKNLRITSKFWGMWYLRNMFNKRKSDFSSRESVIANQKVTENTTLNVLKLCLLIVVYMSRRSLHLARSQCTMLALRGSLLSPQSEEGNRALPTGG